MLPENLPRKAWLYAQGLAGLKRDDIILTSFPKSGNTWVRFFLCNLISLTEWGGRAVDFKLLDTTMPELGVDNLMKPWNHRVIPRVVKTHKGYWPFFSGRRAVLVIRDPRDVMVSYHAYETARLNPRFVGTLSEFMRHPKFGLEAWCAHYTSWRDRVRTVVRYETLKAADEPVFTEMLRLVDLSVDPGLIKSAADCARADRIRKIEEKAEKALHTGYGKEFKFIRSGKSGTWKNLFSDEDVAFYADVKARYGVDVY